MKQVLTFVFLFFCAVASAQHEHGKQGQPHQTPGTDAHIHGNFREIPIQAFISHAVRLKESLAYLGNPLSSEDEAKIEDIRLSPFTEKSVQQIQAILDPYCIALVDISPESRIKVARGEAVTKLVQGGWKSFLVKVKNDGMITGKLEAESSNALLPYNATWDKLPRDYVTDGKVSNRFLDIQMYTGASMNKHLSGIPLEYTVVQLYSKDAGLRDVELGFNVGVSSKDIGFRNAINILFHIDPSVKVYFDVRDDDGQPVMAGLTITDSVERFKGKLASVYPLPSRRMATFDTYPDFFFQAQVYRKTGEYVILPPGKFTIKYTRGPEYLPQFKQITVPEGVDSFNVSLRLKRWINLARMGWYSADHHVHAAGCSHYWSPEEGVNPAAMFRQSLGEDLKVSSILSWGPGWYFQKNNFTGKQDSLSTRNNIMQYDVEVSGFPSSHAGHLVLLGLKEDDYPGTTKIEEWPSWTGPVLKWAHSQGAITGYTHSGDGLEPLHTIYRYFGIDSSVSEEMLTHSPGWRKWQKIETSVPNYIVPKMNGIGANEYIVTVTQGLVDLFSAGNTGVYRELNMWYHTLNAGIRIPISGETDFPCLSDERIGYARSYFKTNGALDYNNYVDALKKGRNYVSDGFSHLMNFSVNGIEPGLKNSLLNLKSKQKVTVKADVAAYLTPEQSRGGEAIATSPLDVFPCWNVERARVGKSRKVKVELIVNGLKVDDREIEADGSVQPVQFTPEITEGSWVALRVYASAHTNPVYINMNNKSVSVDKSLEWCIKSVDRCWEMKHTQIREKERPEAEKSYKEAKVWYESKLSYKK